MRPLDDTWVNGIKVCRERAGLSQEELARRVGTNRQQIQRLEAGGRKLTIEWAARIAKACGCDLDDIIHPEKVDMAKAVKGVVSVFGETDLALTFQDVILSNLLRGYENAHLEVVLVSSEDVSKTAKSGDYVLLDRSINKVSAAGLFLISTWAEERVWRSISPLPTSGRLRVYADADHIADAEAQVSDLTIFGRGRVRLTAI